MAQRFVGQPGGKTAFDKRHSDDSLAPAAQLQRRETSKRLVSWEGNNQLALLDSDYKAAHCRRYTGRATVREPTFSLREFCKAYAYETLPPVLLRRCQDDERYHSYPPVAPAARAARDRT